MIKRSVVIFGKTYDYEAPEPLYTEADLRRAREEGSKRMECGHLQADWEFGPEHTDELGHKEPIYGECRICDELQKVREEGSKRMEDVAYAIRAGEFNYMDGDSHPCPGCVWFEAHKENCPVAVAGAELEQSRLNGYAKGCADISAVREEATVAAAELCLEHRFMVGAVTVGCSCGWYVAITSVDSVEVFKEHVRKEIHASV